MDEVAVTARRSRAAKPARLPANKKKRAAAGERTATGGGRRKRTRKQWALFALKWGAIGTLALTAIGAATIAGLFWYYASDSSLPKIEKISDYRPKQVCRVVAAGGELIGEVFEERRTLVSYDQLPESLVHALVSAEDAEFFEHEGLDYLGMIRALFVNIKEGEKKQGASTITQQVVKNILLSRARTFRRKFQEIILARRLEQALTKEEILTMYANEIYLGHGRYGVQEAARFYFAKDVQDLNVGEAALLAGLPQSPNNLSPKKPENAERAKSRQAYVLEQMVVNGYLGPEEAKKWIDEPIRVVGDPNPAVGSAPEWVEMARRELVERYGEDEVDLIGATVVTSVDLDMQRVAHEALRSGLREYDKRRSYGHPVKRVKPDKIDLEVAKLAKKLPKGGPTVGEAWDAVVIAVHDADREMVVDLGDWRASLLLGTPYDERYNPEGAVPSERFAPGDIVRVVLGADKSAEDRAAAHANNRVHFAPGPQGAVVIIDPHTRRLLAVVGGYENDIGDFNRATAARRQAGSTFKPIVYAAAVDTGDFTAASIVNDAPEVWELVEDDWKPQNYKKGEYLGPVSLRLALAKSINTVAARVARDIGFETVRDTARSLGIESEMPLVPSLALGSAEVTPLELTNAFATLLAGGRAARPWSIARVGDQEIEPPEPEQVLRPEAAYVIIDMMRSVVTEGTATGAASLGLDLAGKTGTSNKARDAWFVGGTQDLVVGVWVGFDDFKTPLGGKEAGGKTALPVFVDIMKEFGKRSSRFARPPGIVEVRIDKASGLLAHEQQSADSTATEVFIEGSAPTEIAPAPGEVDVDSAIIDQYGELGFGGDGDSDGEEGQANQ